MVAGSGPSILQISRWFSKLQCFTGTYFSVKTEIFPPTFIGCNVYFWLAGILDIFRYSLEEKKISCNITEYLHFQLTVILPDFHGSALEIKLTFIPRIFLNCIFLLLSCSDKKWSLSNLPYQHLNAVDTCCKKSWSTKKILHLL